MMILEGKKYSNRKSTRLVVERNVDISKPIRERIATIAYVREGESTIRQCSEPAFIRWFRS